MVPRVESRQGQEESFTDRLAADEDAGEMASVRARGARHAAGQGGFGKRLFLCVTTSLLGTQTPTEARSQDRWQREGSLTSQGGDWVFA